MTKRILITGSRRWRDKAAVRAAMIEHGPGVIVHGACPTGVDKMADEIARELGWEVESHPADWSELGAMAGPMRNSLMVRLGADVCLAFPESDSRGTRHCMRVAKRAGIPVHVYKKSSTKG